jgi:hypothetical protein
MSEVSCPCGAARLKLSGPPLTQFYCHCADCRRVHGAAYVPEAMYGAGAVEVIGETLTFALKTTPRVSCAKCGGRLFADLGDLRGVNGTLLPDFQAELHIHCAEAVAPVRDELPHFARKPVAFGGGDDAVVSW